MDSKDPAILRLVLRNAANYIKALPQERFQLVVVANGPAVTQFVKGNEEFRAIAAPLQDQGLRILLCANALADNKIDHGGRAQSPRSDFLLAPQRRAKKTNS